MEILSGWTQQNCFQAAELGDREVTELSQEACTCDPTHFGMSVVIAMQHTTMEERNNDVPQDAIVTQILDGVDSFPLLHK